VRESTARLTPRFSSNRTVREYTELHYLPAAAAYRERLADDCAVGQRIVNWQRTLAHRWPDLRIGVPRVTRSRERLQWEVAVTLAGIDPEDIRVELYAEADAAHGRAIEEMTRAPPWRDISGAAVYAVTLAASRPAEDYTVRVTPRRAGVAVPLEAPQILWQR
jgi:starch phosphorylase